MRKGSGFGSTFRFIALTLSFILIFGTVTVSAADLGNTGNYEAYDDHGIAGIDESLPSVEAYDPALEDAVGELSEEVTNEGPVISENPGELFNEGTLIPEEPEEMPKDGLVISEEPEEVPNDSTVAYYEDSGPDFPGLKDTAYITLGESYYYASFENPMFDSYFPGKRTVKPVMSKKGIVKCVISKESDGNKYFYFNAVKPGETEITFISTFTGGRYVSKPYKICVLAPVLTHTKFDIASLSTTFNINDYVVGMEGFDRDYTMIWSSSKSSVADVDSDGNITVNGPGTAKIKGILDTGLSRKATVTATINVKIPKINKTSVTLIPGQKVKISLSNMAKGRMVDDWKLSSWGYKVRDDVYRDGLEMAQNGNSCEVTAFMECGGTLTAMVDGDAYVCNITVKAPVIKKKEMKLKPGKSSKISVGGTKFKPNDFIVNSTKHPRK